MSDLEFYLGILLAVLFLVIGIDGWRAWRRPAFNPDEFYEQEKSK